MIQLTKGRYTAKQATSPSELLEAQVLRALCFGLSAEKDADDYDPTSTHILIRDTETNTVVCCYRLNPQRGDELSGSYSAQYYELSALQVYDGLLMELGRFCVHPDWQDPDILRLAWAAMTDFVDRHDIKMLFGCSSFAGVETDAYLDAFAVLKERHLAPPRWLPRVKAPDVFRFAAKLRRKPDVREAMRRMPPLLKTYLMMGGWVSDHAVVDRQMNTLHVFTGLEIGAIPDNRKRLLRALV